MSRSQFISSEVVNSWFLNGSSRQCSTDRRLRGAFALVLTTSCGSPSSKKGDGTMGGEPNQGGLISLSALSLSLSALSLGASIVQLVEPRSWIRKSLNSILASATTEWVTKTSSPQSLRRNLKPEIPQVFRTSAAPVQE